MGYHLKALLLLVVIHLNLVSGNPAPKEIDGLVVGGSPTKKGEYPWIVLIGNDVYSCAGTILNEEWILTAAHCATEDPSTYYVIGGEYDQRKQEGTEQMVGVDKIHAHEEYDPESMNNDIALFHLSTPLSFNQNVNKASISVASTKLEKQLTVVGWGRTVEGGNGSPILLKATISRRDHSVCENAYPGYDRATRICAGDTGKGSCQGDSGGPLHNPRDKRVIGVVSGGGQCAFEGQPGFYTNIAVYADWIANCVGSK